MPNVLFNFTAYIDKSRRPDDFPDFVEDIVIQDCKDLQEVVNFVNNRLAMHLKNGGMGVPLDARALQELGVLDTSRVWVPMHMITYIAATHYPINGEVPGLNEQRETVLPSGNKLVKH